MSVPSEQLFFDEAITFFKNKIKLPTSGWTDIWQEQHSHAFVVAGAAHDALVEDFYNAIVKAKWGGGGYEEFRQSFEEIAAKHGWSYNGSPGWRSKIIYDTNIRQSQNAGRYQQMMAVKDLNPYWQYAHTSIEHPRLEHRGWNGLILSADDPWWDTHMPQNGWGCRCKVYSMSEYSARKAWEKAGKSGPDTAPPIEWEKKTVGVTGSHPRKVLTPKGIDPGFAYNPGKAYLEPLTVPPLTGYDAVLKLRDKPWPTGFTPPPTPKPTPVSPAVLLPADIKPEAAVMEFLDIFGATMDQGAAFTDAAGSTLAVTKALFIKGEDKTGDNVKWLADSDKEHRLQYLNLLAMTLLEPDEIWWYWEQDRGENGRWRLKRRYLRAFQLEGKSEFGVTIFEWGRTGWTGATTFMTSHSKEDARQSYFDRQRHGRLLFKK